MTAPYIVNFTTRPSLDFIRPTGSVNTYGVRGLHRNVVSKIRFSEPMAPATVNASSVYFAVNETIVPGIVTLDGSGTLASIAPASPLPANQDVCIQISTAATDVSGNAFYHGSSCFSFFVTGPAIDDVTNPTVIWPSWLGTTTLPTNFDRGILSNGILSEPVDPWSYAGDLFEIRNAGGQIIPPKSFQYPLDLAPSSTFSVIVKAALDFAGNPLTPPAPLTITTGAGPDNTYPQVVASSPADGAVGVPLDQVISVQYNERVIPAGSWLNNAFNVATISQSPDGRTLTVTPHSPLIPNTVYQATVSAYDLAGNFLDAPAWSYGANFNTQFTTTGPAFPDVDPPTVISINPPNGASGVMAAEFTLTFSEPIDSAAISSGIAMFVDGVQTSVQVFSVLDGSTLTLRREGSMPNEANIEIVVTEGLKDRAGNSAVPFISQFGFVNPDPEPDNVFVHSVRPTNGAMDVAADASIYVFFSGPVNPTTLPAGVYVSQDGALITGQIMLSAGNQLMRFDPDNAFLPRARIRLFLDQTTIRDTSGQPLGDWFYETTFLTKGSLPNPAIQFQGSPSFGAPRNSHIVIDFDREMNPATFSLPNITLVPSQGFTFSLESGNTRLRVVPDTLLQANRSYYLQLANAVQAMDGTPLTGTPRHVFSTSAATITAPTLVSSVSPPDEAIGVGINGVIDLAFSNRINVQTISESTVRWMDSAGFGVPCTVEFSDWNGGTTVRITPHDPFTPFETYTLTIEGVEDLAGQTVPTVTTTFTASDEPDFSGPVLLHATPTSTGAPLNSVVSLYFDEPLSSSTVDSSTVVFRRRLPNFSWETLPAVVSLSSSGQTILVSPEALLAANTIYAVELGWRVRDLSGNATGQPTVSFTTGVITDTTPPVVTAFAPPDDGVGVPINHRIVFAFDTPIRPQSVLDIRIEKGGVEIPVQRLVEGPGAELRPLALLQPLSSYAWYVENVEDLAGNAMSSTLSGTFSTGAGADISEPAVDTTSPPNGATNISPLTTIGFRFTSAVNPRTVQASDFYLSSSNAGDLGFVLGFSADLRTVLLTPADPLPNASTILVGYNNGAIQSATGLVVPSIQIEFTTANN
jgi:hypothetical protein